MDLKDQQCLFASQIWFVDKRKKLQHSRLNKELKDRTEQDKDRDKDKDDLLLKMISGLVFQKV